jgi:hypothetical protein
LPSQVGELTRGQAINDPPRLLIRFDRTAHPCLVLVSKSQRLLASIHRHRENLAPVAGVGIARTCTVRLAAGTHPLDDASAHERLEGQGSQLLVEPATAALDRFALGRQI